MYKNMSKKTVALLMSLLLTLSLAVLPARAVSQEEIDALREYRDQVTAEREAKDAEVEALEAQEAGLLERKRAMDERNAVVLEQIRLNDEEIALYDEIIADKAQEVDAARALEEEQLARYRVRVRAMEESGGYNILSMLLHTDNLSELLTMLDDVNEIMESDRQLEDAYIEARIKTEAVKAEYEEVKADLEEKKAFLENQKEDLWAKIDEANQLIAQLQEDIAAGKEEAHEILLQEIKADEELEAMVAELERQRQEELERQRQAAAEAAAAAAAEGGGGGGGGGGGYAVSTGSFIWPVPSCTYLTSRFGNRFHPIFNEWRSHTGIDIGAGYGASILAADGGTVIHAGDAGNGYGNYVMIDHGNGYITLYGHMSSVAVYNGQYVSQGDTIGYVGSTGWATGPHLHYEIWSGGSRIDPEQFYSGLSYAPDAGE